MEQVQGPNLLCRDLDNKEELIVDREGVFSTLFYLLVLLVSRKNS